MRTCYAGWAMKKRRRNSLILTAHWKGGIGFQAECGNHRRIKDKPDTARPPYRTSATPSRRAAPGDTPMNRLNARLNAASDW